MQKIRIPDWLIGDEKSQETFRLLKRLFVENFRSHFRWYGIAIVAMALMAAMTAASAWIMREIVNGMVIDQDVARTFAVAGAVAAIFTVKGVANYTQSVFLSRAGNSIIADQQRRLFAKIIDSDASFMASRASSDLLVRVTHAAQSARSVIDTIVVSFVRDLFTLLGLMAVMFIQQPMLSTIALVIGPIALAGIRVLLKRVRDIMEKEMMSIAEIIRIVQEASAGFRVVKAYRLENILQKSMNDAVANVESRANSIARLESATSPIMETLSGFAIAAVIGFAGVMVLQRGQTPGEIMSFITALLLAYEPAKRLARMRVNIESGMVGVRMLFELLDHPITLRERPDAKDLPAGPGQVELDSVWFSYQGGYPILKGISVCFRPGKITALVGPSGSGKSTIINLVMRMYDPNSGTVSIDGIDITDVTLSSLRDKISYVGQDTFLFAGSVRRNIGFGREGASDDEIVAAAKAANAHDFIMKLPESYDTDVGESGSNLSGGQKQRLTIARAFLRDSEILILDEATSALDSEAEAAIRDVLQSLAVGRTTIVIAHRLSTIATADHVIAIKDGEVVEEGEPAELLKQDGFYRKLHEYQFVSGEGS